MSTDPNDVIRNGEQENGDWFIMCMKCGDNYRTSKAYYERMKGVRWRCTQCVYDLF